MRQFKHYLALPFIGIGMKTYLFQSGSHDTVFQIFWKTFFQIYLEISKFAAILSAALSQHHLLGLEIAQLEFHHIH